MKLETNPRGCKSKINVRPKAEDDLSSQHTALVSQIARVTPNSQAVSSMIPCCCEFLLSAAFTPWVKEP